VRAFGAKPVARGRPGGGGAPVPVGATTDGLPAGAAIAAGAVACAASYCRAAVRFDQPQRLIELHAQSFAGQTDRRDLAVPGHDPGLILNSPRAGRPCHDLTGD